MTSNQPLFLRARFPLGTYTGHKPDGSSDLYPDAARLHAALMHAACTGSAAVVAPNGEGLAPSTANFQALKWLEEHPPTSLSLPEMMPQGGTDEFSYRKVSSINGAHSTERRRIADGTALAGPICFGWENAPSKIVESISDLIEDVGCLGEGNSPVIIEVDTQDDSPTHVRATDQSLFAAGGERVRIPATGRTEELLASHEASNPIKLPTIAADRSKKTELPLAPPVASESTGIVRYTSVDSHSEEESSQFAPWVTVRVVPLSGRSIDPGDRVKWAVAAHRAFISSVGENVSSLITGKYADKTGQPANGLAIHCVPAEFVAHLGVGGPALLIMLPSGATPADLAQVDTAISTTRRLWIASADSRTLLHTNDLTIKSTEFWHEKPLGYERFWLTEPVIVPEIRDPRNRGKKSKRWTLSDAARLSVGFVWRDFLGLRGKGQSFYRQLVETVESHGVRAYQPKIVTAHSDRYIHKLPESFTAQPYRAVFELGDLLPNDTTIAALGQTRHLSGGLLVPLDFPASFAGAMREEAE